VPDVARTILQRTAGSLTKMNYRVATGHFSAMYEATPGGTSILYMSKNRVYKNGYTFDVVPTQDVQIVHDGNYIHITYTGKQPAYVMINIEKL
jgi:hypothetical protein